jgi:hypothetical protein
MANRAIKNPDVVYPQAQGASFQYTPIDLPDPTMREDLFEQLLANRGIRFLHKKATPCPNMKTLNSNQHDPNCKLCDHDNFIYYQEKEFWGTFIGNSMQKTFEYQGSFDIGATLLTAPTQYPDGLEADFNTMDKLVMLDFEIRLWEMFEWKNPEDNTIFLRYPVTCVEFMCMAAGSENMITFEDGVDFDIVGGALVFKKFDDLSWDDELRVGSVISVSYFANPVYIVLHPLRELRVTQELVEGQKVTRRFPQQLVVKRDHMPFGENRAARPISK